VADPHGDAPPDERAWGWKAKTYFTGRKWEYTVEQTEFLPQGRRIGWVDGADLYLEPEVSYAEAQRLAVEQGESLGVTPDTLLRRLAQQGLLASREGRRQKLTVRVTLDGVRRAVLHMHAASLFPTCKTGPTGPRGEYPSDNGSVHGSGPGTTNGRPARASGPREARRHA
jgi:hypothetical protein